MKDEWFHFSLNFLRDVAIKLWQNLSTDTTMKDILAKITPEHILSMSQATADTK